MVWQEGLHRKLALLNIPADIWKVSSQWYRNIFGYSDLFIYIRSSSKTCYLIYKRSVQDYPLISLSCISNSCWWCSTSGWVWDGSTRSTEHSGSSHLIFQSQPTTGREIRMSISPLTQMFSSSVVELLTSVCSKDQELGSIKSGLNTMLTLLGKIYTALEVWRFFVAWILCCWI